MRKPLIILLGILAWVGVRAQNIQVMVEDFESSSSFFTWDDTTGPGTPTGSNNWIINDEYDGQGTYPNTTRQDSTTIGTIGGAPFSNYLHIYDTTGSVENCNYKPSAASDRFAYTSGSFCTLGLTDARLVFFYVAGGDTINLSNPNAYGEVYYKADGGPWQLAKNTKYIHQEKWKYEQISNPAFDNRSSLQIGFRWVNNGAAQPTGNTMSFGIDDIQLVGTYDAVNNPIEINILQVFPDPICQQNNLIIQWELSSPLCGGTYRLQLSGPGGTFGPNPTDLGVFNIANNDSTGFIAATIPGSTPPGTCYRIRINRVSPQPLIIGEVSVCFEVEVCPNIINTLPAVVTQDPDTVCSLSAIDVPFTSTGVFNANNVYIAELSDSNGDFTNPQVLGQIPDPNTYDPALGSPPGNVSGLIPETPAGCNYYIRVRSTSPVAVGSLYGPFCIKHCDILTNETLDISVCVMENVGVDTLISERINYWDSTAVYAPGNSFSLQLLDMMSLAIVNTGGLGVWVSSVSDTFVLSVPGRNALAGLGIAPGTYYARIIADSSSVLYDRNGTIIRITIGAPDDNPPMIIIPDTVSCNVGIVDFLISPYNQESDYEWTSNGLNNGNPFIWPNNPLLVDFTGAPVDEYIFRVQEINYGCYGPLSDDVRLDIISRPTGNITGPTEVCLGDTAEFQVPFLTATFYDWGASYGRIVDTSNNEVSIVFDSVGIATLTNLALNECGNNTVSYNVQVISLLDVETTPDTTVCAGEPVTLSASTEGFQREVSTGFNAPNVAFGMMFDVTANADVVIQSIDANIASSGQVDLEIYYKQGTHVGFVNNASAWALQGSVTLPGPHTAGTPVTIPFPLSLNIASGDTIALYITTSNNTQIAVRNGTSVNTVAATDGIVDIYQGTILNYPFIGGTAARTWSGTLNYFTFGGLLYDWSTGDSTENILIRPEVSELYTVRVQDTTGCGNKGEVQVNVLAKPVVDAGDDAAVCLGESVAIQAQATGAFTWSPVVGLEDYASLNQLIYPDSTIVYVLSAIDNTTGCKNADTLNIEVSIESELQDTIPLCTESGEPAILSLPANPGGRYVWNTGDTTADLTVSVAGVYTAQYLPGANGCATLYVFDVEDYDCTRIIDIPQAFSPNNDGLNDHFTVFGRNITEYDIKIYNRWGEEVYSSTDPSELNDLNRGWDGTYKGKVQNFGTFVYFIRARDINNITVEKKGNLTLVR